jgi:hypothetical protein
MFLTEKDTKRNLNEFKKEELVGIILGMRMNFSDANEIYETINKHYLKKGININFYVAEFILGEYKAPPIKIDIEAHLKNLIEKVKLEEEIKRKQRINSDFSILYVGRQESDFIEINISN